MHLCVRPGSIGRSFAPTKSENRLGLRHWWALFFPLPEESVARSKNLHREDAKDAKKDKKQEGKCCFSQQNRLFLFLFLFFALFASSRCKTGFILQHSPEGGGRKERPVRFVPAEKYQFGDLVGTDDRQVDPYGWGASRESPEVQKI
jgi:hypothetical protein